MEIWKPIRDFPSYDCSSEGRIRNIRTQRIMRMSVGPKGYLRVCLHRNGEQYTVTAARLIAETFLGGQPDMDIRYKDGDKTDAVVTCTPSWVDDNYYTLTEIDTNTFELFNVHNTKQPLVLTFSADNCDNVK